MTEEIENNGNNDVPNYHALGKVKKHHVLLVLLILILVLIFHFRHKLAEVHDRYRMRRRLRQAVGSFEEDLEEGLTSSNFDIESNISNNDQRPGLLEDAKIAIRNIMEQENISFDEARLKYTRSRLNDNDIGDDGLPRDPRLITFS